MSDLPKEKKRAPEDTADRIRSAILRGEYKPGTDLPGERDLATQLGVSRLTLRAAITRLEAEGLVRSVHGSGNRVLDFRDSGGIELMGHLLAIAQQGGDVPTAIFENLLELRRAAAIEAIGIATERATELEIAALRAHVEKQASLIGGNPQAYVEADLEFARLVARATHNVALLFLANSIVRVLARQPGIEGSFFIAPQTTIAVYRKFVSLIAARDPKTSRAFAKRLITNFDRTLVRAIAMLADMKTPDPRPNIQKEAV